MLTFDIGTINHSFPSLLHICIKNGNCIIAINIFETSILASRYVSKMFASMLQVHLSDTIMYKLAEMNVSSMYLKLMVYCMLIRIIQLHMYT